jgi:MFS transporter, FSR family, fosmidomycin resistance protein
VTTAPLARSSAASHLVRPRTTLTVAGGTHALHDGYSDLLYVLLPIWQAEFGLDYAQIGLLRGLYAGTMASFQVPASMLAERYGAGRILALGTAVAALAFMLASATIGYTSLLIVLMLAGLGASAQHPIGSSLVSRAFEGAASRPALGTYNFAGDLGKMTLPAATAWLLLWMPWRPAMALLGALGLAGAGVILGLVSNGRAGAQSAGAHADGAAANPTADGAAANPIATLEAATSGQEASLDASASRPSAQIEATTSHRGFGSGFALLASIGILDTGTRMGFLTFLPFVLTEKGASLSTIGIALTLVFAGGAVGKFVCGLLGARFGVTRTVFLTEGATAAGILALLPLPLGGALLMMPLIGVALNGTSSVLYGSVPELVAPAARERAFGVFYTATIGAGALAPILYGLFSDAAGITVMMAAVAAMVLLTLPLAWLLGPKLTSRASS